MAKEVAERIQRVILGDKAQNPTRFCAAVKNDVFAVLNDYLELDKQDLCVQLELSESGDYKLSISAVCCRIKHHGRIL